MSEEDVQTWNSRADRLRREDGLSTDEASFAEEWRAKYGESYDEFLRARSAQMRTTKDAPTFSEWRKERKKEGKEGVTRLDPPPNAIYLFKIARSQWATH